MTDKEFSKELQEAAAIAELMEKRFIELKGIVMALSSMLKRLSQAHKGR